MNTHGTVTHQQHIIDLCKQNNKDQLEHFFGFLHESWTPFPSTFNFFWVDFMSVDGYNPLMTAIYHHSDNAVQYLIESCGALLDQSTRHPNGTTALHVAVYTKNAHALNLILKHSEKPCPGIIHQQDKWGKTALHHAYYHGFDEGIEILLKAGSNPDVPDRWGNKPFDLHESRRNKLK